MVSSNVSSKSEFIRSAKEFIDGLTPRQVTSMTGHGSVLSDSSSGDEMQKDDAGHVAQVEGYRRRRRRRRSSSKSSKASGSKRRRRSKSRSKSRSGRRRRRRRVRDANEMFDGNHPELKMTSSTHAHDGSIEDEQQQMLEKMTDQIRNRKMSVARAKKGPKLSRGRRNAAARKQASDKRKGRVAQKDAEILATGGASESDSDDSVLSTTTRRGGRVKSAGRKRKNALDNVSENVKKLERVLKAGRDELDDLSQEDEGFEHDDFENGLGQESHVVLEGYRRRRRRSSSKGSRVRRRRRSSSGRRRRRRSAGTKSRRRRRRAAPTAPVAVDGFDNKTVDDILHSSELKSLIDLKNNPKMLDQLPTLKKLFREFSKIANKSSEKSDSSSHLNELKRAMAPGVRVQQKQAPSAISLDALRSLSQLQKLLSELN